MIKETKREVKELEKVNVLGDKLLFLSLYGEFYDMFFKDRSISFLNYCDERYDRAFDLTMSKVQDNPGNKDAYSALSLMNLFIDEFEQQLQDNPLHMAVEFPESYKEKMAELARTKKHIDIIDKSPDMSLEDKADIALIVDEYVRFTRDNCFALYNEEFAKTLSTRIYDNICNELPYFFRKIKGLHDMELYTILDKYLKSETKIELAGMYFREEADFLKETNEYTKATLIPKAKEKERSLANVFIIFSTVGMRSNNPIEKKLHRLDAAIYAETSTFQVSKYAVKTLGKVSKSVMKERFKRFGL